MGKSQKYLSGTSRKTRTASRSTTSIVSSLASRSPVDQLIRLCSVDMNGIVHPCTHPEGKPAPETEEDMMVEIFSYTERVVNMARPRKVLMMAIGQFVLIARPLVGLQQIIRD